jgi:hypothetical protein
MNTVVFMICLKKKNSCVLMHRVLRSSYQTKIWLIAHIPKPAVGTPLEHGCKDGKFGLEPIKELLRAYASSSSISVLCVITL